MFLPQEDRFDGPALKRNSIARIINEAEELLDSKGWINRNPVGSGRMGHCIGSAIATVVSKNMLSWTREHNTSYHDVAEVMLAAMQKQTGQQWESMPGYNDAPGRTREEVRAVMRLARELEPV